MSFRDEYCHITLLEQEKFSLRKFRFAFLMILVDVLLFKDPGDRNVPNPLDPDPQHCSIGGISEDLLHLEER